MLFLHAVEDETEEDEGVVAVVSVHVPHHPLTQLPKVAGFGELALIHEASPWPNGHSTPLNPLFNHSNREAFGEPESVKQGRDAMRAKYGKHTQMSKNKNNGMCIYPKIVLSH